MYRWLRPPGVTPGNGRLAAAAMVRTCLSRPRGPTATRNAAGPRGWAPSARVEPLLSAAAQPPATSQGEQRTAADQHQPRQWQAWAVRRGPAESRGDATGGRLSGPGGLASFLRRRQLGARLGSPSLPLDIGYSETIPAGIRNAVILRDQHCQWAGHCNQPAAACQVHHVTHKANGGKTSVKDCVLLYFFHHQVVIHRWGWTLALNADGTTTAWSPDRTKVLHSHSPPARAG